MLFFILISVAGVAFAVVGKKLTTAAALTGALLAIVLFTGLGWAGFELMTAFFVLGTLATSWKKATKEKLGLAQENKGRRNTGQVLANAGIGGLLGLAAVIATQAAPLLLLMAAGAFSAAAADTLSSELGSVYGSRFYDVLSFKKGQRGNDGVISREGTCAGLIGSCLIAALYSISAGWSLHFLWIVIAGTAGNLADSILGAKLERRQTIGNDAVNLLNTLTGAVVAWLLSMF